MILQHKCLKLVMYLVAGLLLETEKLDQELQCITPEIIHFICKGQAIFLSGIVSAMQDKRIIL
jgi:hypothetical protein